MTSTSESSGSESSQHLTVEAAEDPSCISAWVTRTSPLLLAGAIVLSIVLRVLFLGTKSFWRDEAASLMIARLRLADFWSLLQGSEANMGLYYLMLRPWAAVDQSEAWIRLLSVLFGVAAVPVMYALGTALFSRYAGVTAALLLSVNVYHIQYSQEARGYSLAVFGVALASLFLVQAVQTGRTQKWMLFVTASIVAVYSHFFAGLVLLGQGVAMLLVTRESRVWKIFLISGLAILAMCTPLLWFIAAHNTGQLAWIEPVTVRGVYHALRLFTGNGLRFIIYLLAFAMVGMELPKAWNRKQPGQRWGYVFCLCWLGVPLLSTLLLSLWHPLFNSRFLLVCLPAIVLLAAQGLVSIHLRWIGLLAFSLLMVTSLLSMSSYYRRPGLEDWRGATNFMLNNVSSDDTVALSQPYSFFALNYYRNHPKHSPYPINIVTDAYELERQNHSMQPQSRIWLVICPEAVLDPEAVRLRELQAHLALQFMKRQVYEFQNIRVILYSAPHP